MVQYSTSRAVITGCIHSPISGPGTLPKPVLHVNPECFSLHNLDLLFNPIYTANIHYVDRERESRVYFRERMMEIITTPIVCVCTHVGVTLCSSIGSSCLRTDSLQEALATETAIASDPTLQIFR